MLSRAVFCVCQWVYSHFPLPQGSVTSFLPSFPSLQAERACSLEHRSGMALLLGEKMYAAAIYNLYMNA